MPGILKRLRGLISSLRASRDNSGMMEPGGTSFPRLGREMWRPWAKLQIHNSLSSFNGAAAVALLAAEAKSGLQ
jgi:hypothetical protein